MIQAAVAKVVAGAVIASGGVVGVTSAVEHCPVGQVVTSFGCGKVTGTLPDETKVEGTTSAVTVPVDFRDANGNRTSSGLGVNDQFHWLGGKKMGKNGDGLLIEVRQTTHGGGGWGSLYEGWIPVKFTQIPSMFN